jgi:hypothetical protein
MSNINLQIFPPGALVWHPAHGNGRVVLSAQDGQSIVRFGDASAFTTVPTNELLLKWSPVSSKWTKSLASFRGFPQMRSAYDSLKAYTSAAKGGKKSDCNFVEGWLANDHSSDHESHNAVAGDVRKDLDAQEHAEWQHDREASDSTKPESSDDPITRLHPSDDSVEPVEGETVTLPIDEEGTITLTREENAVQLTIPLTPLRDLKQRTSKRQRRLLRAFDLWRRGNDWDKVAEITGETRQTIRGYRTEIKAMLGEAIISRERIYQPKDPWTNQFVKYTVEDAPGQRDQPARVVPRKPLPELPAPKLVARAVPAGHCRYCGERHEDCKSPILHNVPTVRSVTVDNVGRSKNM